MRIKNFLLSLLELKTNKITTEAISKSPIETGWASSNNFLYLLFQRSPLFNLCDCILKRRFPIRGLTGQQ